MNKIKHWWSSCKEGSRMYIDSLGYYPYCKICNKKMEFVMDKDWDEYIKNRLHESGLIK